MFLFSKASGPPQKIAACGPRAHGGIFQPEAVKPDPSREAVKPGPGGVEAVVLSSIGWDIAVRWPL